MNIWSHLCGALIFFGLIFYIFTLSGTNIFPEDNNDNHYNPLIRNHHHITNETHENL